VARTDERPADDHQRWSRLVRLVLLAALGVVLASAAPASAADGDLGIPGPSTAGTGGAATGEKPESKLWFNDGRWWASMYHAASGTYHIWWLDRSASPAAWVDSGTVLDNRPKSRADTLWDGSHLYVASAVFAASNTTTVSGNPTRLYRYSYSPLSRSYSLDAGFPVAINNTSTETIVLDKDSRNRLWATWTQGQKVYFNATTTPGVDTSWGTPAPLPVAEASNLDPDDISTLVAFRGHLGVMWSNQVSSTTYFSVHDDDEPIDAWQSAEKVTLPGPKQSDDHLNVKQLESDPSGRIFAVIKTGLDDVAGGSSSAPQIVVLGRGSSGGWSRATFATVADCHTRPSLVLDSANALLHVYATAPESGCPHSGTAGSIFEKTSPMSALSFPPGRGTVVMRTAASPNLNNVTGTKQTATAATGIVMLASNDVTKQYWASDESLGTAPAAPTASFTATPTSGQAPLPVQFTDTSTGSPTTWAWDFGDGASSTAQNPQHTYAAAGTYTASLTASNAGGSSTPATMSITVTAPPPAAGISVVGSSDSMSSTASSAVTLTSPAGVSTGDVLLAAFSINNTPTVTPPPGWSSIVGPLKPDGVAELFAYYHVVAAGELPGSYAWTLSTANKWGGGITAYRGVDASHPLDLTSAVTTIDSSGTATGITSPGVTTVTDGAMLVGGLGADGATATTTPPAGWTEAFDSVGGKMSEHAYKSQGTAGLSGPATWTISAPRAIAVWMTALRAAP
jgi:PKD repeat protein